jgi:hypothetical protein
MKIIAYDRFRPGVTMETIQPLPAEEVANVWRLWKAGVVRENYVRADEPGVIIVFEVDSVDAAGLTWPTFLCPRRATSNGSTFLSWPRSCSRSWRASIDRGRPLDIRLSLFAPHWSSKGAVHDPCRGQAGALRP